VVGLASLSDPDLVPQAVTSRLDVRETPGGSFVEALAEYLGSKKTLLVLDNCEHLIDGCAELVSPSMAHQRAWSKGRER
jgi:predicted ATPase